MDSVEEDVGDDARDGNGEDPCPHDAPCHSPTDGAEALHAADAHDPAGDGVRGRDGNPRHSGTEQADSGGAFGAEATVERDCRAAPACETEAGNPGGSRSPNGPEPEVETGARPSLAPRLPPTSSRRARVAFPRCSVVVVGLGLRSALRAPPGGAPAEAHDGIPPRPQRQPEQKTKNQERTKTENTRTQKGDTSNWLSIGTFLSGRDNG